MGNPNILCFTERIGRINVARHPFVSIFECVRVVFIELHDSVFIKAVTRPLVPFARMYKPRFFAEFFNCIAQIHQNIFAFLGEIKQGFIVVGHIRLQNFNATNRRSVIKQNTALLYSLLFNQILDRAAECFCQAKNGFGTGLVDILFSLLIHLHRTQTDPRKCRQLRLRATVSRANPF